MAAKRNNTGADPGYLHALRQRLKPGETEIAAVRSDLLANGCFGERWTVLTDRRLLVLPSPGDAAGLEASLAHIVAARTKTLVGGSQLEITSTHSPAFRISHTASQSHAFAEFARAIENLKAGKQVESTPPPRVRCERCGRLLPQRDGICPACLPKRAILRRLIGYAAPYWKQAALLILSSILISTSNLVPPFLSGRIIDRVLAPSAASDPAARYALLAWFVVALLLVRLAGWGAERIQGHTMATVSASVTADIRRQLYWHIERLSLLFFSRRDVGTLIENVSQDANAIQGMLVHGLPHLIVNSAMLAGILTLMFWLHGKLALIISLSVPAVLLWTVIFWKRMTNLYHHWWQTGARFSSRLNETLSGTRLTKMFRQESAEIQRFGGENERLFRANVMTGQRRATLLAAMGLVTTAGITTVWLYGGLEVEKGMLTPGMLVAFYGYIVLFYVPLQWFGQQSNSMSRAFTAAQRIFEILDTSTEAPEDASAVAMHDMQGRVTFRDVHFGYQASNPVLRGIDLDVRPGEFIGIVGRSGVGKTTLMHLLCRFYDPDRGTIEIDGVDARKVRLADFRRKIGVVLQEPILFSGTIAENISYGNPGADFAEIVAAARTACAHEFIVRKPDGYDTRIGEGGRMLSQGEKQRISLARCLLCDPRIVILDEATSSVDPISEQSIQRATNQLRKNRTTFAIAHRLATLHSADRIIVLENGRIVEEGSYNQLVARGGTFASLVRLQYETPETVSIED